MSEQTGNIIEIGTPPAGEEGGGIVVTPEEMESRALSLYEQALLLAVVDQPSFERAAFVGSALKTLRDQIVEYFRPMKKKADEAKEEILKREREQLAPVKEALETIRVNMEIWAAQAERCRLAEEERLRLVAVQEAEAQRAGLLAQAEAAEAAGNRDEAAYHLERAEAVYAAPTTVARVTGNGNASLSNDLTVTVTDLKVFVYELVERGFRPTMLEAKVGPLKSWVKSNDLKSFPGLSITRAPAVRFKK